MIHNANGRKWARTFLVLALAVSITGNVAHTVLAESTISLWLRIPGAVIWPVFTFGAIEIVVRVVWQRTAAHRFARAMVLAVATPAVITSYEHLYKLLLMSGESQWIAVIGPAAIDGMMIGCTMVLLFTRTVQAPIDVDGSMARLEMLVAEQMIEDAMPVSVVPSIEDVAPVSPAPRVNGTRRPRGTWDARRVAEMAIDGKKAAQITAELSVPSATAARFAKVARILRENPAAEISRTEKVHPDHVQIMRSLVGR
jgi:hypothetical protein